MMLILIQRCGHTPVREEEALTARCRKNLSFSGFGACQEYCILPHLHNNVFVHKYRGLQLDSITENEGACL